MKERREPSFVHQTQHIFGLLVTGSGQARVPSSQEDKPCRSARSSRRRLHSCQFDDCRLRVKEEGQVGSEINIGVSGISSGESMGRIGVVGGGAVCAVVVDCA
jgi:hypothetical protein